MSLPWPPVEREGADPGASEASAGAARQPVETKPAGPEPLAILPIFLKLRGKRALLAGGSAGAAWKAKLLGSAGAAVTVFTDAPSEEMREAASLVPGGGSIEIEARPWTPEDFDGVALAIAGLEDEAECERFVAAARARGVIVNAVDRPHLCDVQFGAIVNRSPLVLGISTEGAVPVLGQTIRSAIEGLLPRGIAAWTEAAKAWRERVKGRLATFAERRRFWERFADRALAEPHRAPTDEDFTSLIAGAEAKGSVALVGAGPGDPELLTLKAVRALRTADVILHDDLVAPEILDFARREARTMLVGKKGYGPSCRQDEINALMVRLAREGRRVVRLKGGDPLVFGRANEEMDACRQAGVPVEIVPGITSAQGAAARIGASLTHRSVARRVQFVTGHDHEGRLPAGLDWRALADPNAMTVVYMPKRTLAAFTAAVLREGLPAETPAAAVTNATRADEHVAWGTVATLSEAVASSPDGPTLVLIGEALRLASGGADEPATAERTRRTGAA